MLSNKTLFHRFSKPFAFLFLFSFLFLFFHFWLVEAFPFYAHQLQGLASNRAYREAGQLGREGVKPFLAPKKSHGELWQSSSTSRH